MEKTRCSMEVALVQTQRRMELATVEQTRRKKEVTPGHGDVVITDVAEVETGKSTGTGIISTRITMETTKETASIIGTMT